MYIKQIQSETASYYLTAFTLKHACVHSCPHVHHAQVRTLFLTSVRCWWETPSLREHFSCVCFHLTFFYPDTCRCVCAWCHNEGHSVCFPRHMIPATLFGKVIDMLRPASAPLEFTHIGRTYVQTASRRSC